MPSGKPTTLMSAGSSEVLFDSPSSAASTWLGLGVRLTLTLTLTLTLALALALALTLSKAITGIPAFHAGEAFRK